MTLISGYRVEFDTREPFKSQEFQAVAALLLNRGQRDYGASDWTAPVIMNDGDEIGLAPTASHFVRDYASKLVRQFPSGARVARVLPTFTAPIIQTQKHLKPLPRKGV
jgi:hypothetical protein